MGIPVVGSFGVNTFTDKIRLSIYELVEGEGGGGGGGGEEMLPKLDLNQGGDETEKMEDMDVLKTLKAEHRKRNYVTWLMLERVEKGGRLSTRGGEGRGAGNGEMIMKFLRIQ